MAGVNPRQKVGCAYPTLALLISISCLNAARTLGTRALGQTVGAGEEYPPRTVSIKRGVAIAGLFCCGGDSAHDCGVELSFAAQKQLPVQNTAQPFFEPRFRLYLSVGLAFVEGSGSAGETPRV